MPDQHTPAPESVPDEIRRLPQWVRWRAIPQPTGKARKVPICPDGDKFASSTDPSSWGTFEEAAGNAGRDGTCGVGFVFTESDPYVGIDLDDVILDGRLLPHVVPILEDLRSYAEISPSGCGVKIFARGSFPNLARHKEPIPGGGTIEVYSSGRYFTVTGDLLAGAVEDIADLNGELNAVATRYGLAGPERGAPSISLPACDVPLEDRIARATCYLRAVPGATSGQSGHNRTLRVAVRITRGFVLGEDDALVVLAPWNRTCSPPWSAKELRHKVRDALLKGQMDWGEYLRPRNAGQDDDEADAEPVVETGPNPDPDAPAFPWIDLTRFRGELQTIERTRRPTGIPSFDAALCGGLPGGIVMTLTGPPGSCKSAFALQLGLARARAHGGVVCTYAPDQGGTQPLTRLAALYGDVANDEAAFADFVLSLSPVLRIADERERGVTLETFAAAVLATENVAAVIIDTPQTVVTKADDEGERARIDAAMEAASQLGRKLLVPTVVCSHANRASTAARKKEDRTLARSAGAGSGKIEHRSQVQLFMERVERDDGIVEVAVEITKLSFGSAGRTFRLILDPLVWQLRQADEGVAATEADDEKAERHETEVRKAMERCLKVLRTNPDGLSSKAFEEACGGFGRMHREARIRLVEESALFFEQRTNRGGGLLWKVGRAIT